MSRNRSKEDATNTAGSQSPGGVFLSKIRTISLLDITKFSDAVCTKQRKTRHKKGGEKGEKALKIGFFPRTNRKLYAPERYTTICCGAVKSDKIKR